jgi:hypothetical protein
MSDEEYPCDPGYCQLAEVSNYANGLKAKLAKAVEALEHEVKRSRRHLSAKTLATLAEIKGESHV